MKQTNYIFVIFFVIFVNTGTGCATIINGHHQKIRVNSVPNKANVFINEEQFGKTPLILKVSRKEESQIIRIEKENYETAEILVDRELSPWVFGNAMFYVFGIVTGGIDLINGAAYNLYPEKINVALKQNHENNITSSNESPNSSSVPDKKFDEQSEIEEVELGGPRMGFTFLTDGIKKEINKQKSGFNSNTIFQLGWQFEKRLLLSEKNNFSLIMEAVPLIGGLDQNMFLPTITGIIGMRTKGGVEFGIGPLLSPSGSALTYMMGVTVPFEGINIPFNFAVVPFTDGTSFNLLTGFNW